MLLCEAALRCEARELRSAEQRADGARIFGGPQISFLEVNMKAAMEWVKVVSAAVAIIAVVWAVVSLSFAAMP